MGDDQDKRKRRRLAGRYPVPIFVRATEDEARRITAAAEGAGRSASRYLAELGALDEGARLAPAPTAEELAALSALRYELRKVGVNLNQLAHRENSADAGGAAEPPTDAELREATAAVRVAVERIAARLT